MYKITQKILPIAAFLIPLAIYLMTIAPTYVATDSAEFALCMHYWGVCHPPGFGFYIAAGHFFVSFFPFGTLAYKANLLSALYGTGAVFFVYLALIRLGVEKLTAFGLSMVLATSIIFWRFSVFSDVFTFGAFLTSISLFFLISRRRNLAFLFLGLSASHMYLTGLAVLIYIWFLWESRKIKDLKLFLIPLMLFAGGVSFQLLILLRSFSNTPINWGHVNSLPSFFDYLRRKEFGGFFLIANEAATFNIGYFLKHWLYLFGEIFKNFPILALVFWALLFWSSLFKRREYVLFIMAFFAVGFVQLLSLSTIDPADEIFEFDKFYVLLFVIFVLISGLGVDYLAKLLLKGKQYLVWGILAVLVFVNLIIGAKVNNFSNNTFTENLVTDALTQLPDGAVAITIDHPVYYGFRYEKEINRRFEEIEMVYILNNNPDYERYNPKLFERERNQDFFNKVKESNSKINKSQIAVLNLISKNINGDIYILQGSFEEKFFQFLEPYIKPYGLWWKVVVDSRSDFEVEEKLLDHFKNSDIRYKGFVVNQQKTDSLIYAISYKSAGVYYASKGEFEKAGEYFRKALGINPKLANVENLYSSVEQARELTLKKDTLWTERNFDALLDLSVVYYTLGYFRGSVEINERLSEMEPGEAIYLSNLGSGYAQLGERVKAQKYFEQALGINPDLELAKQGLEKLRNDN